MGKSSDDIYREIEQHRQMLSSRISNVENRVKDNVQNVKSTFSEKVTDVKDNVQQQASDGFQLQDRVRENPLTYTLGAFGAGVVLGMISEGVSLGGGSDSGRDSRDYRRGSSDQGQGLLTAAMASFLPNVGSTIQDEVNEIVRQAFSGFRSRSEPAGTASGNGQMTASTRP